MSLGKKVFQALLACMFLASCDQELMDKKDDRLEEKLIPAAIDYNEDGGSLSHLIYRAKFRYNSDDQLVSVTDTLLTPMAPPSGTARPWVNFYYQEGRLAEVVLRHNHDPGTHYDPKTDLKTARFYFSVRTRQVVEGQQKGTFSFKTDANGFPVRKNVRYGSTYLDAAGNIDFVAENNAAKARNPLAIWEILEQTFDQNKSIFANSKEFQMLGVLLAAYNWDLNTTFVPYLGILTTNNQISKTLRFCSKSEGCREPGTILSETASVNSQGYPTRRFVIVGAMGRHQFVINYKEN
ncbi:hypothetical protein [Dyadobacter sp.]|uniref:hypothetical protein n=1 Tax=Dyadobacter sp. TaxID=1914288 RepID=UPI003F70672D